MENWDVPFDFGKDIGQQVKNRSDLSLSQMDIQLPVMDGIEATKAIRGLERSNNIGIFPATPNTEPNRTLSPALENPPGTPLRSSVIIVALTASSFHQDRVNALAAGCNDFLTKPVSLKWLESKIVEWGCMQVSLALFDADSDND